ncbi:MAG: tetratricopeptide repeat protein [Betaproteobacteria bacterium]
MSRNSKRRRNSAAKAPAAQSELSRPASSPTEVGAPPSRAPSRRRWLAGILGIGIVVAISAAFLALRDRTPTAVAPGAAAVAVPNYVGGAACADCHAQQQAAWHGSQHDLAMQVADDKAVLGDFASAKFSYAGVASTFFKRDGKHYVNTDGPDGKLADYEIKYAFGVAPLQQYLIELPGGRMQALSIAWDSRAKEKGGQRWFHLYPGQNIKAGDPLHWTGIGQNWNFQCAECHSTNLRKNFDAATDTFKTTWSELNVSCEACHGPGSNHVAWAKKAGDWKAFDGPGRGLPVALDERRGVTWAPVAATGNAARSVARAGSREIGTCARCHGRAGRLTDDYVHGKPPGDSHRMAILDEGLYWSDGQMRDEVYNWGSFLQSRMYAAGVTCSDCHDPHTLKLKAEGNAVCAQCHQPAKYDVAAHTHHAEGTPGAACTACHMPTTTYMVVDPRHDHSMRIPRPDLSAKLGTPNACNQCHANRSPQWAADALAKWVGKTPIGYQRFAEALAAGTSGAPGARGALLAIIDDGTQPAIVRASALARLGRWLTPSVQDAISRGLNDPDAVVRSAAVGALSNAGIAVRQRYLPRMLDDPVRVVRIDAARALAGDAEAGLPAERRPAFAKALDEYIAAQTYVADRPEGRMSLANLYAARGDAERAIAEYRKVIAIDPTFVPGYANLADLYRARGAEGESETALREGLARNPRAAVLHHALGLSLARQRRTAESLAALREAARIVPDDGRFAYVYAVALNSAGRPRDALTILEAVLKARPYDRDVLSGLAYFNAQAGNRDAALGYARQLRELDPENREYAGLAEQIGQGAPR